MAQNPPISIADARESLRLWEEALRAASAGSSYSIGGRTLTRQDIDQIRAEIQRWHNTVTALEADAAGNVRPLGATAAFPAPGRGGSGRLIPDSVWRDYRT